MFPLTSVEQCQFTPPEARCPPALPPSCAGSLDGCFQNKSARTPQRILMQGVWPMHPLWSPPSFAMGRKCHFSFTINVLHPGPCILIENGMKLSFCLTEPDAHLLVGQWSDTYYAHERTASMPSALQIWAIRCLKSAGNSLAIWKEKTFSTPLNPITFDNVAASNEPLLLWSSQGSFEKAWHV